MSDVAISLMTTRQALPIGVGAAVAAVLAHGFVYAGCNLDRIEPIDSYQGFFQSAILILEAGWSKMNGWEPQSHIQSFGPWFAKAVHFGCPTIGFILFCLVSRQGIGRSIWKPFTIVSLFTAATIPLYAWFMHDVPAPAIPRGGTGAAIAIVFLMIWSVGGLAQRPITVRLETRV